MMDIEHRASPSIIGHRYRSSVIDIDHRIADHLDDR